MSKKLYRCCLNLNNLNRIICSEIKKYGEDLGINTIWFESSIMYIQLEAIDEDDAKEKAFIAFESYLKNFLEIIKKSTIKNTYYVWTYFNKDTISISDSTRSERHPRNEVIIENGTSMGIYVDAFNKEEAEIIARKIFKEFYEKLGKKIGQK